MTGETESGKFMLCTRDRVFYAGLLGRGMKTRRMGGAGIYVAPDGPVRIKIGDGPWQEREIAALAPGCAHRAETRSGRIISLLIEPERVEAEALERLIETLNGGGDQSVAIARIRGAAGRLRQLPDSEPPSAETFDRLVLGRALAGRTLDARIETVLERFDEEDRETRLSADTCAGEAGLSTSRFLHLFKEQTGVSFRALRMWKQARGFLYHANHDSSLTDVAFALGYPDSSHFSHSIRRIYGLQPRSIRVGSRDLEVLASDRACA